MAFVVQPSRNPMLQQAWAGHQADQKKAAKAKPEQAPAPEPAPKPALRAPAKKAAVKKGKRK